MTGDASISERLAERPSGPMERDLQGHLPCSARNNRPERSKLPARLRDSALYGGANMKGWPITRKSLVGSCRFSGVSALVYREECDKEKGDCFACFGSCDLRGLSALGVLTVGRLGFNISIRVMKLDYLLRPNLKNQL
jgi:hypothetical protein